MYVYVTYNQSSQKSALNASLILANANNNKKAPLSLANPRDAKACQKLLQFDVKTGCRKVNDFFEVTEIRCLIIKFLIQITSTYCS